MKVYKIKNYKEYINSISIDSTPAGCELVTELPDELIDFNSLVRFDGEVYCISSAALTDNDKTKPYKYIIIRRLADYKETDKEVSDAEICWDTDFVCPVCGYVDDDPPREYERDWQCPECGSILEVDVDYTATYTTHCTKANRNILEIS